MSLDASSRKRVGAIVQARMGSSRFPGKVLTPITPNLTILDMVLGRLKVCPELDAVVVATSTSTSDDPLASYLDRKDIPFYRGSEPDCLLRVSESAVRFKLDVIVRVTADCPLVDPQIVGSMVRYFLANYALIDYLSNRQFTNYPEGVDTEVFKQAMILEAAQHAQMQDEREHINYYFLRRPERFRIRYFNHPGMQDFSRFKLSVDVVEDLKKIQALVSDLGGRIDFPFDALLKSLCSKEESYVEL